jgi:hypothetical protein
VRNIGAAVSSVSNNKSVRYLPALTALFCLEVNLFAQSGQATADRSALMSDYNAVINRHEVIYDFDIVKDSLLVRQHFTKEMVILTDFTKSFTDDMIFYDSFSSVEDLKALTMIPGSKGFEKISVTHFVETNDQGGGIFYDDSRTINFVYPSLKKGAKTTLNYTLVHKNPRFLNKVFLQSWLPVINGRMTVKTHKDIKLGFRFFNCDPGFLHYTGYSKGKYNYHVWETKDVTPYKYLDVNNYSILYDSPHAAIYIEEARLGDSTVKYYSTVRDLYDFYYSFLPAEAGSTSVELTALAESITRDMHAREKAKAIYYWVQDNIKYVAYSEGYRGFVPASAEEVFVKRFGDCKGKTSLIKKMMEIAGLKAYFAWVGTRELPYTYEELPLPSADNHMVVAYPEGDSFRIVDGTFRFIDFDMYPFNIQGKEAMVSIDRDNYSIFRIPVSPASESIVYDSVSVCLSGDKVTGNGFRSHSGFNKYELAHAMEGVKSADYNRRLSTLFSKGNNKFIVDSCTIARLHEHDVPASVSYRFHVADYARKINNEIYINLNLDRSLSDSKIDTTIRYAPVVNDFHYTEKQITHFMIPDGYEVSYLPGDDVIDNEIIRASFRYHEDGAFITLEKELQYKFLILDDNQIGIWNSTIDRLNNNYRLSLVLNRSDAQSEINK